MTETQTSGPKRSFGAFPKAFWTANGIELFERGAYYTFNAVLFVFQTQLYQQNGMSLAAAVSLAGLMQSVIFLLLYVVPVVSAPFAEKYGYRASLVAVFALLTAGYLVTLFATGLPMIITAALLIGLGAGIFKPIPAAVVTQTSTEEKRNLAFSIYYAFINIGALVFPLSVGLAGIRYPDRLFQIAFLTAGSLSALNLVLSLVLFRNLRAPDRNKNILETVARLGEIRHYPAFLVLMAIYAGFWFMYALAIGVMNQYMLDFNRMPAWFNVQLFQSINPAVIILGAPFLGALASRFKPLTMITVGILVYSLGLVLIGFTNTWAFFVLGAVGYSVGELLTHPAYLAYVSRIVPPEKVSVFLGYGFIPIGVGQFAGGLFGSLIYARIAITDGQPVLYWALMAGMGVLTVTALIVYNYVITPRAPPVEGEKRRGVIGGAVGAFGVALLALLLGGALVAAAAMQPPIDGVTPASEEALDSASLDTVQLDPVMGTAAAGEEVEQTFAFAAGATGTAAFILEWEDEAAGPGTVNDPDSFELHVTAPNGTMVAMSEAVANGADGVGKIELMVDGIVPGDWIVTVKMVAAGQSRIGAPGPVPLPVPGAAADAGNDFGLVVSYQQPK